MALSSNLEKNGREGELMRAFMLSGAVGAALLAAGAAFSQGTTPDTTATRVKLPADYAKSFRLYDTVDKAERKIVRFLYVNRDALAKVSADAPFPNGTVIVMEDREVALDTAGKPIVDAAGRLQPTGRVKGIAVMAKELMWGDTNAFPSDKDNGDWEYAAFRADGSPNPVKLDTCYACHLPQKGLDFTFSGKKIHEAAKK